ncbi:hypothetical protein NC99_25590 [Sunxiuqinia dokdonensis]|uniref:Uncharacterized protein n=1 Tax=Sunxiuqinia dokdonensis TaxID=1409788 RepID=A0A0L8V804_9BACT|nr:hypothetical protein NC99_25590 [Sunxiuqinia dokdonensis]
MIYFLFYIFLSAVSLLTFEFPSRAPIPVFYRFDPIPEVLERNRTPFFA